MTAFPIEQAPIRSSSITRVPTICSRLWQPVKGAVGYNVRWGLQPDRLTQTYQIFALDDNKEFGGRQHGNTLDLRALNVGVGYYVAVEAFDENGVSTLSKPIRLP